MSIGEGFSGKYMESDPLQAVWNDPARLEQALYAGERFLVMPDDCPVAPHHLLVVAREPKPIEELAFADRQALWALAGVISNHMTRILRPSRKVGIVVWGNQVRTGHLHLVPRNLPSDATQWQRMEFPDDAAREAQLAETRQLLALPPDVTAQADFAVHETLKHLRGIELPPIESAAQGTSV